MTIRKQQFVRGIILRPDDVALEGVSGELKVTLTGQKLQVYLNAAVREVLTADQAQVVTNKTINAPDNTITNIADSNVSASAAIAESKLALSFSTSSLNTAITDHINDTADAHDASAISNVPAGTIAATDVQAAINELDGDIQDHINDASDAHDASAISNVPSGNLVATDVQGALNELQTDVDSRVLASGGTLTNGSIITPARLDVKQDTKANLETYALTATNGQIVFATDEKQMYQVVDGELVAIGGAGIVKITAGENLAVNDLVYISTGTGNDSGRTAGRVYKVDASNDDRTDVLGFATKVTTTGNIAEIQVSGIMKGFAGLTPGKLYYASTTPGAISLTPPSANGQWIVAVGLSSSATEIVLSPAPSAGAIYITDADTTFTVANNQASAADVTGLLFDPITTRSFVLDYSIYRQTDTASSALAQAGQLRGVYNTQSGVWLMSDDYSGQNAGVVFSIQPSGQIRYTSSNIAGANYVGTLKYNPRKTFGV
jgi:hypothetical protein